MIEKSGIGSGSLSVSGTVLKYTVNSATTISGGTYITLEIAKIIANQKGSFTVAITTKNSNGLIIDGPTQSSLFSIFGVGSNAISPLHDSKNLFDDSQTGGSTGWNPNGVANGCTVMDSDLNNVDRHSALVVINVPV